MPWWNFWKRTSNEQQVELHDESQDDLQDEPLVPPLMLGTEDSDVFHPSISSDDLAVRLLNEAVQKSKDSPAGAEVTVEVSEEHLDVHHMELMLSCMNYGDQYGLLVQSQYNNSVTFVKL